MFNETYCFHGSDLEIIEQKYGIAKDTIINFSNNVNPLGISPLLREKLSENIDLIATYPDRHYTALRKKISNYTNAPFNNIIVGNGSTELISLAIQIISPKKSLILGPTYSEYEKEIYLNGGASFYYRIKEDHNFSIDIDDLKSNLTEDFDLLIICNPNNPTSSALEKKDLRKILDHCKENDIYVLIDETYVEFAKDMDNITAIPLSSYYSNLLVIRGVSKFFAAPGLRLGYCICGNKNILTKINEKKNPWTISALASLAGEIMLDDKQYILKTQNIINNERLRITNTLSKWNNIKISKPIANFILIKILKDNLTSQDVFNQLIKDSIMIRDASSFPFLNSQYIRFCFLTPQQNDLLINKLYKIIEE